MKIANAQRSLMKVHPERVQQIMRYAVAVASNADDFRLRELGPIHLIKYVFLADLAYAKSHAGRTYTGVPWRFHHFGPYATEAWQQIAPAMELPVIRHRSFRGRYQDDVSRWRTDDPSLEESLERELPFAVARAVKAAIREFSNDTSGLLHHVYRTPPMLHAAPQETLDFSTVIPDPSEEVQPARKEEQASLSKAALKHRKEAHEALRTRFQEALQRSRSRRQAAGKPRPPRYDEIFERGRAWLDNLAGEPIEPREGELIVSEEVWKSPARSEPRVP